MTIDSLDMVPTRVLIVDDAASTRLFLRGVLDHCPQFDVAGEADNGATAIEMAEELQPDVVLLDLSMPVTDGASALSGLLSVAPNARVIVLSGADKKAAAPVLAAGATAFLPKGLAPFELLDRLGGILRQPVVFRRTADAEARPGDTFEVSSAQQLRAIVCDDDPMARRLIARILDNCDVPVLAETDGVPHLLAAIEISKPELLVLDLWLEGTSGTSALPEIRRLSPETIVVAYSAHSEWREKVLAGGATAFILKPHFDELEAEIRRLSNTTRS